MFINLIIYHSHPLSSSTFVNLILYHPHPLSSLSFIILSLYYPQTLSSPSCIIPILYHPQPLSTSFFIILILYHPHPLSSSSFIILINIKQDVLDGRAAAGTEPGTFSPGVFWRARAPNNVPFTRQNFDAATIRAKVSPKYKKNPENRSK